MNQYVSSSRFAMWRAVVALAHADGVVTPQELAFITESLADVALSAEQRGIIQSDLGQPQNIEGMFSHITAIQDRKDFFILARILCWSDGDFDRQERAIIKRLERLDLDEGARGFLKQSRAAVKEVELDLSQWQSSGRYKAGNFLRDLLSRA